MKEKNYTKLFWAAYKYAASVLHNERISIEDDEDFFEILKMGGRFLQTSEAIERIILWQKEVNDKDGDISFTAQEKLTRIGSVLALKDKGIRKRAAKEKQEALVRIRQEFLQKIKTAGISKCKSEALKRVELKKLFHPNLIDRLPYLPRTNAKLANIIMTEFFGYTLLTVERYLKGSVKARQ